MTCERGPHICPDCWGDGETSVGVACSRRECPTKRPAPNTTLFVDWVPGRSTGPVTALLDTMRCVGEDQFDDVKRTAAAFAGAIGLKLIGVEERAGGQFRLTFLAPKLTFML